MTPGEDIKRSVFVFLMLCVDVYTYVAGVLASVMLMLMRW